MIPIVKKIMIFFIPCFRSWMSTFEITKYSNFRIFFFFEKDAANYAIKLYNNIIVKCVKQYYLRLDILFQLLLLELLYVFVFTHKWTNGSISSISVFVWLWRSTVMHIYKSTNNNAINWINIRVLRQYLHYFFDYKKSTFRFILIILISTDYT